MPVTTAHFATCASKSTAAMSCAPAMPTAPHRRSRYETPHKLTPEDAKHAKEFAKAGFVDRLVPTPAGRVALRRPAESSSFAEALASSASFGVKRSLVLAANRIPSTQPKRLVWCQTV